MLLLCAMTPAAHADDTRRFSVALSAGAIPDMAGLGASIAQDGSLPVGPTSLGQLYSTDHLLMSDQQNQTLWHSSSQSTSVFRLMSEAPQLGGPLLGGELGGRLRLESAADRLPGFVELGAFFSTRISGGQQARTLGSLAQDSAQLAAILKASGESASDYVSGHLSSEHDAAWIEIPLSVGLKTPDLWARSFVYGSLGVSYMRGGYVLSIDADERYSNVLASHLDADTLTITNHSPGAVSEQISFAVQGLGLNYGLGVQTGLGEHAAVFADLNRSGLTRVALGSGLSPAGQQLLSAMTDPALTEDDATWFQGVARSISLNGASIRIGLRRYFH